MGSLSRSAHRWTFFRLRRRGRAQVKWPLAQSLASSWATTCNQVESGRVTLWLLLLLTFVLQLRIPTIPCTFNVCVR